MIGIRKDDPSPSSIQHEEPIHYGLREYDFQTEKAALDELCLDMYGVTPNTRVLAERFGGYDIAKVTTNTIFSVGELDPWGGGGVTIPIDEDVDLAEPAAVERGVYFFRLQNGAHHIDLRGWHRDEPMDVRHTRLDEERIIVGWITQHFSDREASASMATVH
jgi:lysosomal Pro-X carboxypeptidase